MEYRTLLVGAVLGLLLAVGADGQEVQRSVVKILAVQRGPNLLQPWQRQPPQRVAGSGVVIDGQRILTNAHLAMYAGQIEVQPFQSRDTFTAKVVALSPAMDLAILKLDKVEKKDEQAFFKDRPAIRLAGKPPQIKDNVNIYGYPIGGAGQSVTKGTVSRIEYAALGARGVGLRVEVSAGVNIGNSGGPALVKDQMVGLVFAVSRQGQNLGYLIAPEEIAMFLDDIRDGQYAGKPQMWDVVHRLENAALRAKLGLDRSTRGILVTGTSPIKPTVLQKGDIITKIGDHDIDNVGMVSVKPNLHLPFMYLVSKVVKNDTIPLTLIRNGQTKSVESRVFVGDELALLKSLNNKYPSYFVWGPLVFSPATTNFVGAVAPYIASDLGLRNSPLMTRGNGVVNFKGEELVVVTAMFPHKTSKGYDNPVSQVVSSVNGKAIRNLRHLAETLRDAKDKHIEIEFADRGVSSLVFDRQEVLDCTEEILADNSIRKQFSPDLSDVWKGKD